VVAAATRLIAEVVEVEGASLASLRSMAITACRSSRLVPDTRTASPWMLPWTLILLSLIIRTIFLARSPVTPFLIVMTCLTLSPLIFSTLP
jgi:hypothetical protein